MDARLFDGRMVWSTAVAGECRASLVDRTWWLAKAGAVDMSSVTLAHCSVAVKHLGCSYDPQVMNAIGTPVRAPTRE